jgi:type II secretory pathway pseudopilin PulG
MPMKMSNEAGSTTIEVLVALIILSIAGAALIAGSRSGISAAAGAQRAAVSSISILRLDDAVRRAALRVRIPYWDRSVKIVDEGQTLAIPWFDGDPAMTLSLGMVADTIVLETGGEKSSFTGIKNAKQEFIRDEAGSVKGIDLRYEIDGRELHVLASFGAFALPEETP